ncbi:UDP-N-acetylmuramoyl-L-alanine--D-glutamate ligase [Acetobacter fallax]|uniref:UDP-N-acetylmuramoylalanine--D-glutamate ligase n=1 Tax=Acetobacter fallax TaxID=1737473 RepID=A0ABX0K728_9PROT|nr:UDP-N-acetylmuramoyl-L-alanine--D-glutamate ligase [Acetobacter fallax]NHO32199.1 UDP-N-acetylmuramoyl-L-alanine--D-glutamate ligase [Acetobacter fallax]NHO35748.1 UDP-N-acetylmuramoyl-L-alanine--D-glutamate ligase [Acetobacter fallax]
MLTFAPDLFAGHRFVVLGLGRNGTPAARALAAMGADVQAWDDGEAARAALLTEAGEVSGSLTVAPVESLAGVDALVMSPGIPHVLPVAHPVAVMAREAGVAILSDADLLFQAVRKAGSKARFAGITGTNGKSTTTALLAHLLRCGGVEVSEGGNLGPASLSLPLLPDDGVYVLEMSSYMLERLSALRFDVACLLNLTPDHLDRHGDMVGYAAAKTRIFDRMGADDLAVIGNGDSWCREIAASVTARGVPVQTVSGVDEAADFHLMSGAVVDREGIVARPGAALPGAHNAENACAALAMALKLGVARGVLADGIGSFGGLAHRQKLVAELDGVAFVDDSKATNADATSRALGCYGRIVWIAGGIAKAGGIADLVPYFLRITEAFLIGRDAPELAETLAAHGVRHSIVGDLEHAVPEAYRAARAQGAEVVLLSPACASFDQFSGFEARGLRFAALTEELLRDAARNGSERAG